MVYYPGQTKMVILSTRLLIPKHHI
uniref:Uncharacterized protein n=1 Tax=Arundo donax TaxID=35708 RepID=A0A0A9F834_ARUDO